MSHPAEELTLQRFAEISAAIAEGDAPLPRVLAAHGLSADTWAAASQRWSLALAADEALADTYDEALVRAQDQRKPVPVMTPEQWASLVVEVAVDGAAALARHELSRADHLRLTRHWARALGADKRLATRFHEAFYAAQRAR
jgi:hypothetical protein